MAASPDSDIMLELARDYDAPIDLVFRVFFDADALKFIWSTATYTIVDMTMDAQVGGGWRLAMRDIATRAVARCTARFTEIEQAKRIVWFEKWLDGPLAGHQDTRVTLQFEPVARGTRVKLTHEFFPDRRTRDQHVEGWASGLERLARHLAPEPVK